MKSGLATVACGLVLSVGMAAQGDVFEKATISVQVNGKTETQDVIVHFTPDTFAVMDKKTRAPIKQFPYTAITGAEYSYAKSPRWKTAIFVSPLFLFTSGKKHWLLTQGPGDYALLRLDKSNYKLVLAALEAKTGKRVEIVADNK